MGIFRGEREGAGERIAAARRGAAARREDRRSWLYCCISAILSAVHAMPLSARRQC